MSYEEEDTCMSYGSELKQSIQRNKDIQKWKHERTHYILYCVYFVLIGAAVTVGLYNSVPLRYSVPLYK